MPVLIQPRPFNLRKTLTVLAVLGVATWFYYQRPPPPRFWILSGETMGTTYSVKLLDTARNTEGIRALKAEIDALLAEVNRQMSTYLPDSEITTFNAASSIAPFPVSPGFATVTRAALALCTETGGAFNPTLDRLIEAWGFGREGARAEPSPDQIAAALALTGCDRLTIDDADHLTKSDPAVSLNLNAIAKGWGVDEVARLLESAAITNYFVEIGGEVFARGHSEKIRPWRAGVDQPVEGSLPGEGIADILEIDGVALATSGNYRNHFINEAGHKVVHLLDPRTGRPTTSSVASVSVIAPDCLTADALATGLFVLGPGEGIPWAEARPGIEVMFLVHAPDGNIERQESSGFARYRLNQ
jgi:thiamine biosynthesis lipoprotein